MSKFFISLVVLSLFILSSNAATCDFTLETLGSVGGTSGWFLDSLYMGNFGDDTTPVSTTLSLDDTISYTLNMYGVGVAPGQVTWSILDSNGSVVLGTCSYSPQASDTCTSVTAEDIVTYDVRLTCPAINGGDPHFQGFNGMHYTVDMKAKSIYNLISDKDVVLNCGTVSYDTHSVVNPQKRVYMDSVGILLPSQDTFSIHIQQSKPVISVNQKLVVLPQPGQSTIVDIGQSVEEQMSVTIMSLKAGEVLPSQTTTLKHSSILGWHTSYIHYIVDVHTNGYSFSFFLVNLSQSLGQEARSTPVWIVDFSASIRDNKHERTPHGLFGQTWKGVEEEEEEEEEDRTTRNLVGVSFKPEGKLEDYEVTHLFDSKFTFSRSFF